MSTPPSGSRAVGGHGERDERAMNTTHRPSAHGCKDHRKRGSHIGRPVKKIVYYQPHVRPGFFDLRPLPSEALLLSRLFLDLAGSVPIPGHRGAYFIP